MNINEAKSNMANWLELVISGKRKRKEVAVDSNLPSHIWQTKKSYCVCPGKMTLSTSLSPIDFEIQTQYVQRV